MSQINSIDTILEKYSIQLANHKLPYANHCKRVLEICKVLDESLVLKYKNELLYALAFHDLGIWTSSFDYIQPSIQLAKENKIDGHLNIELITLLISEHHKIFKYKGAYSDIVNIFRKADLIDLSLNVIKFGIPKSRLREINSLYPYIGFHRFLVTAFVRWVLRHPWNPLPMYKL